MAVCHGAGPNPIGAIQTNIVGTADLLEAARIHPVEILGYAATVGLCAGPERYQGKKVDENSPVMPNNIYTGTKVMCEVMATHYAKAYGIPVLGDPTCLCVRRRKSSRRQLPGWPA